MNAEHAYVTTRNPQRQRGLAAIEFAIVFPLFFMVFYAIVTYGLIFIAQQSITMAAAEGARAALRYAATDTLRTTNARNAALGNGSTAYWLNGRLSFSGTIAATCPYNGGAVTGRCYTATVTYANYRQNPLVPLLLGGLMRVAVPTQLSSTAVVQLD